MYDNIPLAREVTTPSKERSVYVSKVGDEYDCSDFGRWARNSLAAVNQAAFEAAVPLAGKYRLIDVPISNCLNAGLNKIYVLTQFQSASLHQHIQAAYRFDRFGAGFVEVLAAQQTFESKDWYQGTADAVRQNLPHFSGDWTHVLILSGDQLYRMDFNDLLQRHIQSNADMSIAALPVSAEMATSLGILKVDSSGKVCEFYEKPAKEALPGLETADSLFQEFNLNPVNRPYLASMGIYIFSRKALMDEVGSNKYVDFGKNLFPDCIKRYKVQAYLFDGYWEDIGTVKSFHEANLMIARDPNVFEFVNDRGFIYTCPRTLPPSQVSSAQMKDSLITDGGKIGSANLDQCVIGIRSMIGNNVTMKRTIMMGADYFETDRHKAENKRLGRPNIGIGNNVEIENAIVDKNVRIGDNVIIRSRPDLTETPVYKVVDGILCVLKEAVIPSNTRIGVD